MGRKTTKPKFRPTHCLVCGDRAIGVNFNAATCMSCRAFFRRNAIQTKVLQCPFEDKCIITRITRKFCASCRLAKCFNVGMKKEWILTEEEKQQYKEKIIRNRLRREVKEKAQHSKKCRKSSSTGSDCSNRSISAFYSDCSSSNESSTEAEVSSTSTSFINTAELSNFGNVDLSVGNIDEPLIPVTSDNLNFLTDDLEDPFAFSDLVSFVTAEENFNFSSSNDFFTVEEPSSVNWSIVDLDTNKTVVNYAKTQIPQNQDTLDFLLTSLTTPAKDDDMTAVFEDPLIESLTHTVNPHESDHLFREIGFPTRELILPEKCLLKELTTACSVLANPYHQIREVNIKAPQSDDILLTQHYFYRAIRMAKSLKSFSQFATNDQASMLKLRLLEMVAIRSAQFYLPDRKAWCFMDDKTKASVMIPMNLIQPFCRWEFRRHQAFPSRFRDEWIRDDIIFNLLTIIILFSPKEETYSDNDRMKEEHLRYTRLLSRYLEIKYPTFTEAESCFKTLLGSIEEMRLLISDIRHFFYNHRSSCMESPLLVELFELQQTSGTTMVN